MRSIFFFNRECGPFHLFHLSCFPGQRRTGWVSSRSSQNNFGRNCIRPTSRNSSIHWHNYLVHKHSLLKSNARCHTFPLDWPVDYQHPTAVCPQWECEGGAAPVVTTAWLLSRATSYTLALTYLSINTGQWNSTDITVRIAHASSLYPTVW